MVRSLVLLSAIFATLVVALAGCAAPFSRGLLRRRLSLRCKNINSSVRPDLGLA